MPEKGDPASWGEKTAKVALYSKKPLTWPASSDYAR